MPLRRRKPIVFATSRRGTSVRLDARPARPGRDGTGQAGLGDRKVAHQVADVGHHPVVAGLDEPVVVEPGDVLLEDVDLLPHYP